MSSDNAVYTQGSNFGTLLEKGVDPRTGQYTCAIDIWETASQARNCPSLKLTLCFNSLSSANVGLGEGWLFNLSSYDPKRRTLDLSTGESFQVRDSGNTVTVPDQQLLNFKFEKVGTDFRVIHKSGQIEVLRKGDGLFDKYVPCEIYGANGRRLELLWTGHGGHPRLVTIQESASPLLQVDYQASLARIIRYPNTAEESAFRFSLTNGRLGELVLPLPTQPSWTFDYEKYGLGVCITGVKSPTGLIETMEYKADGHRLPPDGPTTAIPYVSRHIVQPGNAQPNIVTRYEFSDNNYLGFGANIRWDGGQDNLYQTPGDYEYWSRKTVEGGMEFKNTYNHFHLLKLAEQTKGANKVTQEISYYATITGRFEDQVPQFQLPTVIKKTYEDDTGRPGRTETTIQEYDEWANPIREVRPDGVEIRRTYYDPGGETSSDSDFTCPPDPHGFKRYMKTEAVIPADTKYPAPTRTETYLYKRIATAAGAPTGVDYFVTAAQQLSSNDTQLLTRTAFTYVDQPNAQDHGRLNSQVTSQLNEHATTKAWEFNYPDDGQIAITTHTTTFDELTLDERTVYSTLSGLIRAHKDQAGVEDQFEYNALGQVTSVTVSSSTQFEANQTYDYTVLGKGEGVLTEVTDVEGLRTRYISDGLERQCLVEKQDPDERDFLEVSSHRYGAQNQCVASSQSGWMLEKGSKRGSFKTTQQLEYDDWGQVYKTVESTGKVTLSITDPIDRSTIAGIEGEGTTKTWYNGGGRPLRIVLYREDGSLYSEKKYRYDGLNRLVEEEDQLGRVLKYTSDSFDRITDTAWSTGRTASTIYDKHSQATLPAAVSINDHVLGEQQFDGLGRMMQRNVGPRTTTQTYEGSSPEPAQIKDAHGNVCAIKYEPAMQYMPARVTSDITDARFVYDNRNTPGRRVLSEYLFSMGGLLQRYTNPHQHTQSVVYDEFGRPRSMLNQVGMLSQDSINISFQHDNAGRITEHRVEDLQTGTVLSSALTYDDFGREVTRAVRKDEEALFSQEREYNEIGLLEFRLLVNSRGPFRVEKFGYDDQNRLTSYGCTGERPPLDEQGNPIQEQTFTFDDYNNIISKTTVFQDKSSNTTSYVHDPQDSSRLLEISNSNENYPSATSLSYDTDGRLTRDEQGRQLEYDTLGRLIKVSDADNKLLCEYRYDACCRLVSQIVPNQPETHFFYREESLIATKTGDRRTSYLSDGKTYWGQITQEGENQTPQAQLWAGDAHGTTLASIDTQAPDNVHYQSYTPYGLGAMTTIGFNGQWRDPITGWYHLGNGYRVYNPVLQRFHSPDPRCPFSSGEVNPYAYCNGNPINLLPGGHFSLFGIDDSINWRTFSQSGIGTTGSVHVGCLAAGASLAVEVAVGAVVGQIKSVAGGVIGDLANGKIPTWGSAGIGLARGAGIGIPGPIAGGDDSERTSQSSSAGVSQFSRPQKVGTPYVRGSNRARDSIRLLQKDGYLGASTSSSTMGQSIADTLNVSFCCTYALSRKEGRAKPDSASFDALRARIRASAR